MADINIKVTDAQPLVVRVSGPTGPAGPTGPQGIGIVSFLVAESDDQSGLLSNTTTDVAFTNVHDGSGTDIEIDGDDNTKINILSDGWYLLSTQIHVYADTDSMIEYFARINSVGLYWFRNRDDTEYGDSLHSWGPVFLSAGTVLTLTHFVSVGDSTTWTIQGENEALRVVKLS